MMQKQIRPRNYGDNFRYLPPVKAANPTKPINKKLSNKNAEGRPEKKTKTD